MKKIVILTLVLAFSLSIFTGCFSSDNSQQGGTDANSNSNVDNSLDNSVEDNTDDQVADNADLFAMMDNVYAGVDAELPMVESMELSAENISMFLGLENMDNIDQAVVSEALISSIAHSVVLVNVTDGADVEAMKTLIREKIDPRKWVCVGVEREEVIIENKGNTILVVINQEPETAQAFKTSFENL